MGAMGGGLPSASSSASWVRGIHLGEARTLGDGGRVVLGSNRPWANPPKVDYWLDYELDYW